MLIELRTKSGDKLKAKWNPQQNQIIIRDRKLKIDAAFTLKPDESYEVEEIPITSNSNQIMK